VDARDSGRFLLLLDAAVFERDLGFVDFMSIDESANILVAPSFDVTVHGIASVTLVTLMLWDGVNRER
jgi:hypothetical protein